MKNSNSQTQDQIVKKIRSIANVYHISKKQTIGHINYDIIKLSFYKLEEKKVHKKNNTNKNLIILKRELIRKRIGYIKMQFVIQYLVFYRL